MHIDPERRHPIQKRSPIDVSEPIATTLSQDQGHALNITGHLGEGLPERIPIGVLESLPLGS